MTNQAPAEATCSHPDCRTNSTYPTAAEPPPASRGYIYVASSWRNHTQPIVVDALRNEGFEVYDFKNPPNETGFAWKEIGLEHSNPRHGDPYAPDLSVRAEFLAPTTHGPLPDSPPISPRCSAPTQSSRWHRAASRPISNSAGGPAPGNTPPFSSTTHAPPN